MVLAHRLSRPLQTPDVELFGLPGPALTLVVERQEVHRGVRQGVLIAEDGTGPLEELDRQGRVQTVRLSELFADGKDTLFVHAYMYGPNDEAPCVLCTAFLDSLNGDVAHLEQQINVAAVARSDIHRVAALGRGRGWTNLRLLSSKNNSYHHDYLA